MRPQKTSRKSRRDGTLGYNLYNCFLHRNIAASLESGSYCHFLRLHFQRQPPQEPQFPVQEPERSPIT